MAASSRCGSGARARRVSFFFSSRRRHTRFDCDWSSDVCSSDLSKLAYLINSRLWVRDADGATWRLLVGAVDGPSWSPDDQRIAFTAYPPDAPNEIGRASCRERV